ncbi:MAG TPA: carbohydrate-binding protein [Tepidisphaeraceae bacterium]|jgi:hypothetical protein|nr:carbohydrate-binding protein [Tepidisphaeraceae bacterium]
MHSVAPRKSRIEILEDRVLLSTSWFVSMSGSDANPGTLALPFATIQHAANLAHAGDVVNIRAGVYRETVSPPNSGVPGAPITFQAYNGETVIIDGCNFVVGWTPIVGSIYAAPLPWDLGDGNNQMFSEQQVLTEARWPNTGFDPMLPTFATADNIVATVNPSGLSTATITEAALGGDAPGAWVGATIHISPRQGWVWQTGTVIASSPGSITYSYQQLTQYEIPKAGDHFYLSGKLSALDSPGEFYRDPASGYLYLWSPNSDNPNTFGVDVKARDYAFDLSNDSYVNVTGIRPYACTINTNAASTHDTLAGIAATFVSQRMDNPNPWNSKYAPQSTGIILNGSYNLLTGSWIGFSSGNGVFLGGSNNSVQNTAVVETNYAAGDEAAVSILGSNDTVSHDIIIDSGRSGVNFYASPGTQILNNVIHDVGLLTSDAGGTYCWETDGTGSEIAYNVIYNVRANAATSGVGYGNTGIFLDDDSHNFLVDHNVVYNADSAMKMNLAAANNRIYDNTLTGSPNALMIGSNASMFGSVFDNNIFQGATYFAPGFTQSHNLLSSTSVKFADPANFNFQLQPGSAAIDAGVVLSPYTNGYVGAAPDIGAYEYGVATWQAGVFVPSRDARSVTQAESLDAGQGVVVQSPGLGQLDNGDWAKYAAMNFGSGISTFTANLAVLDKYAGKYIDIRLDSPGGKLIGTLTTAGTGAWTTYTAQQTTVSGVIGIHDLYLVFRGGSGVCNLDWFKFG